MKNPAFAIEKEVKLSSMGTAMVFWIVIMSCDILIFMYRMSTLSQTLYRSVGSPGGRFQTENLLVYTESRRLVTCRGGTMFPTRPGLVLKESYPVLNSGTGPGLSLVLNS